jgi:sulfate adenylyltransferase
VFSLKINSLQYFEILNLINGCYYPVNKFMNKNDIENVIFNYKFKNKFFPLPIHFNISKSDQEKLKNETNFQLIYNKKKIGIFYINDFFKLNKKKYLKKLFGTESKNHTGVKNFTNLKDFFISGSVKLNKKIKFPTSFKPYYWKSKFKKYKLKSIAGFHTRNIPHSTHEKLHDIALEKCESLLIHPMTGKLKKGDFTRETILKSYKIYLKRKNRNKKIFFEEFLSYARFGGPREAAFHAIVRKNFGCTHFIIGRDHAGIKNFYSKYASQNFCLKNEKKIGLKILSFKEPYYCKKCRIMRGAFEKCSHKKIYKKFLSGTVIRRNILKNKKLPNYYLRKEILNKLSKKSIR